MPEEEHLFDISPCKCFPGGIDGFTLEGCTCNPRIWDQQSLEFYADQRTTQIMTTTVKENELEVEEGDAAAAFQVDIAMMRTELEDLESTSVIHAQMQMEDEGYENMDDSQQPPENEDVSFESHNPRTPEPEMEEGKKETAKQRAQDADWKASGNSIDTLPEMQLKDKGPRRCTTSLEAFSAVASRRQIKH